jgi:flagellar biosynthesis protein FlhB
MTRQEVITEQKEQQGNAKIRQTVPFDHYASERIPPSLVLVGKTIAISIRWNPTTMTSPVVLAFIREDEIDSITEKAKLQKIPVEVNYWLCSRVEQSCDIGTAVPPSLHSEIASVLTLGRRKIA